ncbi:DUF3182 family protein [Bordetella sp. BOR01]|uniref:DUF3182 family protein n=1 Tax=Bordetella sp. BOR01 TaxID=2854779 RepID=UPI001C436983|nr:DUF3182 family protein [Bordetella sp. BOR01]MBV7486108.1 DUF3182 family protein [Bordetella sp. BOR01]
MPTLPASNPDSRPDLVVAYPRRLGACAHDTASHRALAARLASLLGCPCDPDYDPAPRPGGRRGKIYYVPAMTLGSPAAARLDIRTEADLFGGVVPYDFVASKAITHPVPDAALAPPPAGWSARLGLRLQDAVLAGYTVFSAEDALHAGTLLLRDGPVRLKPVQATAGRGQVKMCDQAALREAVRGQDVNEIAQCGLVLEEHLEDVVTYSVGTVQLPGIEASYVGTQQLTRDNDDNAVYGGSDMLFVRGGFDALAARHWPAALQQAIALARRYDAAVQECYPGFFASRRNYDVAEGLGPAGDRRRGVLEQSWRAGGASMAEACALEAFSRDPSLQKVRARAAERYGDDDARPSEATIVYDDDDPHVGHISKSAGVVRHGDA